jgi:hypothetical protein
MRPKQLIAAGIATIIVCCSLLMACRKNDLAIQPYQTNPAIAQFFTLPNPTQPAVARIAQKLQQLHRQTGFISTLIEKDGFALWDKALIHLPARSGRSTNSGSNSDTLIYIPLALSNSNYVDAFIYAKLGDSIQLQLHRGREFANYGFGSLMDTANNAEKLAVQLMLLNENSFGHKDFKVLDDRLLKDGSLPATARTRNRMVHIEPASTAQRRGFHTVQYEVCTSSQNLQCTSNHACCPDGSCSGCQAECWHTSTVCQTLSVLVYIDNGDWGLGDGGNTGGGGSGGGIFNPNGPQPCNPTPLLDNGLLPCEEGNLTGWTIKDEYGFLFTRKAQLDSLLTQNKFSLLPCDSLTLMPFLSYGPMYQKVAQQQVSQAILNKLDSLSTYGPSPIYAGDLFSVQSLNDASGTIVNCDFFPVKISQMPLKPNGIAYTPKELVEYFRIHKNDFISPSIGISFEPYNYNGFNDSACFNAPYEQSIGAILHIDMTKDGSIVHTGYTNYINPINNYQEHSFIYTTLSTFLDFEHPVSGNREFGIYSDQNSPGSYVFYTMGTDRITNYLYETIDKGIKNVTGRSGFDEADELWTNIQENMINFINTRGGQANFYASKNTIARPIWDVAGDFLMGIISLEQLKQRLGC